MTRVVIGLGNPYRRDDGAGIAVAARVRASAPPGVEVHEHDGEALTLIDDWGPDDEVVVVDAVCSGATPGSLHLVEVGRSSVPLGRVPGSSHGLGVADAFELARALDRLPRLLLFVGIEGGEFGDGPGLSPDVQVAVERVVGLVLAGTAEAPPCA